MRAQQNSGKVTDLQRMPRWQTHIHQTVCENEYSTILLVKVPVAVHIDISSSRGLRCPPLIVLCRPGISVLTSILCRLIVLWHLFVRDDFDEQENECASYENRPCLAALARAELSNPQPSHVTTVRPGCIQVKLGGFMMGLESPRWSTQHVPWSTTTALRSMRSEASHCVVFLHENFHSPKTPILTRCPTILPFACVSKLFVP